MRTYSESDKKTYPIILLLSMWVILQVIYWSFLGEINTFSCNGLYCKEQSKSGIFGKASTGVNVNRADIVDVTFSKDHYRHRRAHSSHYDYRLVLVMKDGTNYPLKIKYCGKNRIPKDLISKIRGSKSFKETTRR